jgi:acetyl esterase
MARRWTASFADADPDPPDSALRPETAAALAESSFEFTRQAIAVSRRAVAGDLSLVAPFRAAIDAAHRPYASAGVRETVGGARVVRYGADPALPLLLYVHGGGWMHGLAAPSARFATELARAVPAEVLALDYSLSPEAPPGAAIAEALAVWSALPRGRAVFVGGDSAGGSISAGLIFTLLARGMRAPDGAFMIYPAAELRDMYAFSVRRYARRYGMDDDEKMAYVYLYTADERQQMSPEFSAVNGDVSEWPPTLVVTAQFDTLRDEGRKLAVKLLDAGKLVRYKCVEGTMHACVTRDGLDGARAEVVDEVRRFVEAVAAPP